MAEWFRTRNKKFWLGCLSVIVGVLAGLYFGLVWAFVGGIVQVIGAVTAPALIPMDIAVGVLKVVSSSVIGTLIAYAFLIPGWFLIVNNLE